METVSVIILALVVFNVGFALGMVFAGSVRHEQERPDDS